MKTTILKTHGVRDGTEERSIKNWAAKHADDTLAAHKAAIPIDHPDQSVTARKIGTDAVTTDKIMNGAVTEAKIGNDAVTTNKLRNGAVVNTKIGDNAVSTSKIADGAVTADKLGADVTEMLSDLQAIVDKEYNLTDLTGFAGGYTAAEIPLNKFVKITNDTDEELTFFQDHDEYGTALSSPIPARSSRIIIKVKNPVGGAGVENGYCIVLDGLATKQDVTNLARFVTSNQTAIATINGNDTVTGSTDKKIKDAINAFATQLTNDGPVNTYKEALDWIAAHGSDYTALLGQVNTNTSALANKANTSDVVNAIVTAKNYTDSAIATQSTNKTDLYGEPWGFWWVQFWGETPIPYAVVENGTIKVYVHIPSEILWYDDITDTRGTIYNKNSKNYVSAEIIEIPSELLNSVYIGVRYYKEYEKRTVGTVTTLKPYLEFFATDTPITGGVNYNNKTMQISFLHYSDIIIPTFQEGETTKNTTYSGGYYNNSSGRYSASAQYPYGGGTKPVYYFGYNDGGTYRNLSYLKTNTKNSLLDAINELHDNTADLAEAVSNKVDKVTGKGLSTLDYDEHEQDLLYGLSFERLHLYDAKLSVLARGENLIGYNIPDTPTVIFNDLEGNRGETTVIPKSDDSNYELSQNIYWGGYYLFTKRKEAIDSEDGYIEVTPLNGKTVIQALAGTRELGALPKTYDSTLSSMRDIDQNYIIPDTPTVIYNDVVDDNGDGVTHNSLLGFVGHDDVNNRVKLLYYTLSQPILPYGIYKLTKTAEYDETNSTDGSIEVTPYNTFADFIKANATDIQTVTAAISTADIDGGTF